MRIRFSSILALALFSAPAAADQGEDTAKASDNKPADGFAWIKRMMTWEPMMDPAELQQALVKAKTFPLGSHENPVRAESPIGQRAYLRRLRCADGHAPYFSRLGNLGPGVYRSIVDDYVVDCGASAPGQVSVKMDMYFKGHVEVQSVPGFTIVPPSPSSDEQHP
jgi:hypothetical protein